MTNDDFMVTPNQASNAINAHSEKRRAFVAPLFTAGYGERYDCYWHFSEVRASSNTGLFKFGDRPLLAQSSLWHEAGQIIGWIDG